MLSLDFSDGTLYASTSIALTFNTFNSKFFTSSIKILGSLHFALVPTSMLTCLLV